MSTTTPPSINSYIYYYTSIPLLTNSYIFYYTFVFSSKVTISTITRKLFLYYISFNKQLFLLLYFYFLFERVISTYYTFFNKNLFYLYSYFLKLFRNNSLKRSLENSSIISTILEIVLYSRGNIDAFQSRLVVIYYFRNKLTSSIINTLLDIYPY